LIVTLSFISVNIALSQQEKVITNAGVDWSPEGKKNAFHSNRNWEIYIMDISGKNVKRLTLGQGSNK